MRPQVNCQTQSRLHFNPISISTSIQFACVLALRFFSVFSCFWLFSVSSFCLIFTHFVMARHRSIFNFLLFALLQNNKNKNKTQAECGEGRRRERERRRTKPTTKMKTCTKFAILIKWYENCKSHEREWTEKRMKTEKNMRNKMGVRCAFLVPNCDCSGIILVEGQISYKLS